MKTKLTKKTIDQLAAYLFDKLEDSWTDDITELLMDYNYDLDKLSHQTCKSLIYTELKNLMDKEINKKEDYENSCVVCGQFLFHNEAYKKTNKGDFCSEECFNSLSWREIQKIHEKL
jgi:hypothetical protein